MKSQDVLLLFKLISLEKQAQEDLSRERRLEISESTGEIGQFLYGNPEDLFSHRDTMSFHLSDALEWQGWDYQAEPADQQSDDSYTVRALAASLSLSKSEVSNALTRCRDIGLVTLGYEDGLPKANSRALLDLVANGLKYVFPVRPGATVRGIPTGFAAPILEGKVMSGGDLIPVWPDPKGKKKGQAVAPIYKTVPEAVKRDYLLCHYLALVDAIRLGSPREADVANQLLRKWILHE